MAIDTNNKKFSLITWQQLWNMPLPSTGSAFTQGDKQHLIAEYSGIDFNPPVVVKPWIAFQVIRQTINN